jgi:hypothetical protein
VIGHRAGVAPNASALPPGSGLLSRGSGDPGWQNQLTYLWGRRAHQRARDGELDRSGLAVRLPLRQATAVLESISGHEDLVSATAAEAC